MRTLSPSCPRGLAVFVGKAMGMASRHALQLALDLPGLFWRPLAGEPLGVEHLAQIDSLAVATLRRVAAVDARARAKAASLGRTTVGVLQGGTATGGGGSGGGGGDDGDGDDDDAWIREQCWTATLSDGCVVPLVLGGADLPLGNPTGEPGNPPQAGGALEGTYGDFAARTVAARLGESLGPLRAVRDGLAEVVPAELLPLFTPQELQRIFCGTAHIDIVRANTSLLPLILEHVPSHATYSIVKELHCAK
jgi:hypothetical protein